MEEAISWRRASSWRTCGSNRRAGRKCQHNHQAYASSSLLLPKTTPFSLYYRSFSSPPQKNTSKSFFQSENSNLQPKSRACEPRNSNLHELYQTQFPIFNASQKKNHFLTPHFTEKQSHFLQTTNFSFQKYQNQRPNNTSEKQETQKRNHCPYNNWNP